MRPLVLSLALVVLSTPVISAHAKTPEDLAKQSAKEWLELTDAGKYGQSWEKAAKLFKSSVTKKQWDAKIKAAREPLGKVISRELQNATYAKQLPGVPDGEYVVIQYNTSFEKKKSAIETVTPMLDGTSWKVSGYFIK
jgi:hypothetical protein